MTNVEHLIENAIVCIENKESFVRFSHEWHNREMSKMSKIALEDIWQMAIHIVYTIKQSWVEDTIAYFQNEKLFDPKMKEYIERLIYD